MDVSAGPASIVWSQQPNRTDDQAVNPRLLVRRQKMHGSQMCYGKLTEVTAGYIWHITDAGATNFRDWYTVVDEVPKTTATGLVGV